MLLDWLLVGVVTWALAAALNASAFKSEASSRLTAWILTIVVFFALLVVLSALQSFRYAEISKDIGFTLRPRGPIDLIGAITLSWLFFSLLRRKPSGNIKPDLRIPHNSSVGDSPRTIALSSSTSSATMSPESTTKTDVPAEEFWEAALGEFEGEHRRAGLWARSFAEAEGNETIAKARYLRHRANELSRESGHNVREHPTKEVTTKTNELPTIVSSTTRHVAANHGRSSRVPKHLRAKFPNCTSDVLLSDKKCPICGIPFQD